jgi:hypothetical protein
MLGWHYAIDGYLGIILTILIWMAVGKSLSIATERNSH